MTVPVVMARRPFECPKCTATVVVPPVEMRAPLHPCRGMAGLMVPMVPAGMKATHVVLDREDYVGTEDVQTDADGRVVMAVHTMRDDGHDTTVYVPTAHGTLE